MTTGRAIELVTEDESQTIALGETIGRQLKPGDFVALHGQLGAGKTRLVRGIAQGMGLDPSQVSSPTFVLVNIYSDESGTSLVHVDAYRLTSADELGELGWDRLTDGSSVVVIEWAERIINGLPGNRFDVAIEDGQSETARRIRITSPPGRVLELQP